MDPHLVRLNNASRVKLLCLLLCAGNIEEAIGHLINLVQFSSNPSATLLSLQQVLPPPIFNLLLHTLKTMQQSAGPANAAKVSRTTCTLRPKL